MDIPNFIKEAINYSFTRIRKAPKKITPTHLAKEIEMAMALGETSGAERILDLINKHKDDPNFKMEDLEAAIHIFISTGLNYVSKTYQGYATFPLERVLKTHGYYKEKHDTQKTETSK